MNRVAGLVLAGVVLLLNVTLTQSQDGSMCPLPGAEPSVPCDAAGNCFRHCCLTSGVCPAFSCGVSLDATTTEAGTICSGKCLEEVRCNLFNPACLNDENDPVCIGAIECLTANCDGRQAEAGSICLTTGNSFKICSSVQ
jgi:hypothetical protein